MTIFNDQGTPTPEQLLERYGSPEELAKGKIEADKTIAERERELAELREELSKRLTYEQLMESLGRKNDDAPTPRQPEHEPAPVVQAPVLKDEDLEARIREELAKADREKQAKRNADEVTAKLLETFGTEDKANEYIRNKAKELGVGVDFLEAAAIQSPAAFYRTIGLDAKNPPAAAVTSGVNAEAIRNTGPKAGSPETYSYFRELRRTNPELYFSSKVQNQLHNAARNYKDGVEAFYKT